MVFVCICKISNISVYVNIQYNCMNMHIIYIYVYIYVLYRYRFHYNSVNKGNGTVKVTAFWHQARTPFQFLGRTQDADASDYCIYFDNQLASDIVRAL